LQGTTYLKTVNYKIILQQALAVLLITILIPYTRRIV